MATKKALPTSKSTSKSKSTKGFSFSDFDKQLSKIPGFELGSILEDNTFSEVDEWIPTGNYLFSAQLSGSLFGGIPNNRSVMIAGDPGAGKSFVCLNIAREAQKMGYNVIYCDTEGAIDKEGAIKFGIDPKRLRYQPIQTVSEFKHFVLTVIDMMEGTDAKTMIVVDSLGMLGTDKEMKDAREGHNAGDMGLKAKELRSLFRSITFALTKAKIPLLCTNHVYTGGGYIPTKEASGGLGAVFSTSIIPFLSKAQLKEGDSKTGIIVTSKLKKNRFTVPFDIKFHISFTAGMNKFVGLEDFVSWDACGIQRGKIETAKDFAKMSKPAEFHEFDFNNEEVDTKTGEITSKIEKLVFIPTDSGRWCVKHLGKSIVANQFFTDVVFTKEVLTSLDEKVIKPTFILPDLSSSDDIANQLFDEAEEESEKA